MNKKKNIIIIIELIIILILGSLIIIKCINPTKQGEKQDNKQLTENNQSNENTISQEEAEKIVKEELYILNGKTNINQITNQQKLSLALSQIKKQNTNNEKHAFTAKEIENAFQNTSIASLGIEHENINAIKYIGDDGNPGFGYTYNNGNYENEISTNSGMTINYIYGKKISYNQNNDTYILSIQYLWSGFGEMIYDCGTEIYGNYNDAKNNTNSIGNIPLNILETEDEKTWQNWFNENYESLKNKIETYNYVLKKENGKIQLVDFYINSAIENNNMNNTNEQTNTTIDDTTKQKIINNIETYNTYYYQQFQCTNTDSNDTITTEDMMEYRRCLDYNNITEITNYYKSFTSTNYFDESIKERFIEKDNKLYTYVKGVAPYTYEKNSFEITNIETVNNIIEITGTYKTAENELYEEMTHQIKAKFIYENNNLVLDNIESIDN